MEPRNKSLAFNIANTRDHLTSETPSADRTIQRPRCPSRRRSWSFHQLELQPERMLLPQSPKQLLVKPLTIALGREFKVKLVYHCRCDQTHLVKSKTVSTLSISVIANECNTLGGIAEQR